MSDLIKASLIDWEEPPMELVNSRWFGPRGAFLNQVDLGPPNNWRLCCPACGQLGSPKQGTKWTIEAGSFEDIAHLTLRPSIQKECCNWHGYLTDGKFKKC